MTLGFTRIQIIESSYATPQTLTALAAESGGDARRSSEIAKTAALGYSELAIGTMSFGTERTP